jgi:hypothetical protein
VTTEAVLAFLTALRALVAKRRHARLWAPKGLRALGKALRGRGGGGGFSAAAGEDALPEGADTDEEEEEKPYARDPDSRPPMNAFQRAMNGVHHLYRWSKTPEALVRDVDWIRVAVGADGKTSLRSSIRS